MINNSIIRAISKRILNGEINYDHGYYITRSGNTLYRLRRQQNDAEGRPQIDIFRHSFRGKRLYAIVGDFAGHYVLDWAFGSLRPMAMRDLAMSRRRSVFDILSIINHRKRER